MCMINIQSSYVHSTSSKTIDFLLFGADTSDLLPVLTQITCSAVSKPSEYQFRSAEARSTCSESRAWSLSWLQQCSSLHYENVSVQQQKKFVLYSPTTFPIHAHTYNVHIKLIKMQLVSEMEVAFTLKIEWTLVLSVLVRWSVIKSTAREKNKIQLIDRVWL